MIKAKNNGLDLYNHSKSVEETALYINHKCNLQLNEDTIKWMCRLHDIGKANPLFQSNMINHNYDKVCRHEISSMLFIDCVPSDMRDEVALSILSHHKSLNDEQRGRRKI